MSRKKLLGLCSLMAACLLAGVLVLLFRFFQPPSLHLRIETFPSGCDVWMSGQHVGISPLELDLTSRIVENDAPRKDPAIHCVVNVIAGGKESVVELDTFLDRWKVGRLRLEAGQGKKLLVDHRGSAPLPERTGFNAYRVTLPIWVTH